MSIISYIAKCIYWKKWKSHKSLTLMCGYNIQGVSPPIHSVKLKIIYGSKNEQNYQFRHYFHSYPHVLCIKLVATLKRRGVECPPPPLNETLLMNPCKIAIENQVDV